MKATHEILREELEQLRARYDWGAVPASVYSLIKSLETDLAWSAQKKLNKERQVNNG